MKAQEWNFAARPDFGRSRPRVFLAVALVSCAINLHSQTTISNPPLTNTNQVMRGCYKFRWNSLISHE